MVREARKISLFLFSYYLLTSALVLLVFAVRPGIDGYARASFPDMVYGRAHKPYVQRILLPVTVRLISEATPGALKAFVSTKLKDKRMVGILGWDVAYLYEYLVGLTLMLACFFGFAFTLRRLIKSVYNCASLVSDLAPIGGLLVLPLFFRYYSYPYDPPTLLLFALATYAVLIRRPVLYYLVFLLATLNKETSILLIGLFFVREYRGRLDLRLLVHSIGQLLLWGAVRGILLYVFRDAPGNVVEFHLIDHNLRLPIGHPISFVYSVAMAAMFFWLIGSGWSSKPLYLRRALMVTIIPIFVAIFFFGYLDELRDYFEAFTFVFLLSLPTIANVIGVSLRDSKKFG